MLEAADGGEPRSLTNEPSFVSQFRERQQEREQHEEEAKLKRQEERWGQRKGPKPRGAGAAAGLVGSRRVF